MNNARFNDVLVCPFCVDVLPQIVAQMWCNVALLVVQFGTIMNDVIYDIIMTYANCFL